MAPDAGLAIDWLGLYLLEDLGERGDVTSDSVFDASHAGRARIVAEERCVLSGGNVAAQLLARLGATATPLQRDGAWVEAGHAVLDVAGPSRALLAGERTALNLIARMSGVATATRRVAERLAEAGCGAVVAGTRKTTPGFRRFEKQAIVAGGGVPHRMGLFDEAMVKDNHREAAGGDVAAAVAAVKRAHPGLVVTAEVESLDDALAAAGAGAEWLLIDNQPPDVGKGWARRVWDSFPDVRIEASGGITLDNVAGYGWADRVSLGALTHQTVSARFTMEWVAEAPAKAA